MKLTILKVSLLSCIFLFTSACGQDNSEPLDAKADTGEMSSDTGLTDTSDQEDTTPQADTNDQEDTTPQTDTSEDIDENTEPSLDPFELPVPNPEDTIVVGEGSGRILIHDVHDKQLSIMPGTYYNIDIKNVTNTSIDGFDTATIQHGDMHLTNVRDVTIRGLTIQDNGQAVVYVNESANNLIFKDITIKDITNYVFRFGVDKPYDGTPDSYCENIHLININAENVGSLFVSSGSISDDGFTGLIKGFKLTRSTIKNSPHLSNGLYISLAEDYEISHNTLDNVNRSEAYPEGNNDHNGLFHLIGNGKLFGNKITNHQGNMVRAWLISITEPDAVVEIYNNTVYNSTRYSAFELQVTPWLEELTTFVPAHAKVYNNTVGKLNTGEPKYYEGRILDLYGTHGNLEFYNNLYFDMRDDIAILNMSGSTTITRNENNLYFEDANDAVEDLVNFKSKTPGLGAQ